MTTTNDMRLDDEEKAMLAGALGAPRRWAIEQQIRVGRFFDARDMVKVSQVHLMADTESLGPSASSSSSRWRRPLRTSAACVCRP